LEGNGQLVIGPTSVEESQKHALELGSNRSKDGEMVQLHSVNFKRIENTEPNASLQASWLNLLWSLREKTMKWHK